MGLRRRLVLATGLALLAAAALVAWRAGRRAGPVEAVAWRSDGVPIAGTLHLPAGAGPHPACVLVPGHGDWTRDGALFRAHAERLARRGLAVLAYDKRGCGASGGGWRMATLADLAGDALGGHARLAADPRVDAGRVGLIGTSQGGLVAALAAAREPAVAFVVALSPSLRPAAEHDAAIAAARVRRAGFGAERAAQAAEVHAAIVAALRAGREAELLRRGEGLVASLVGEPGADDAPWLAAAELTLLPPDAARWEAYRRLPMDLDPAPVFAALDAPLLTVQGGDDWIVPGPRGRAGMLALRAAGADDLDAVLVPGAGHGLRARAGWGPFERWTWPEAYWSELEAWLGSATE